MRIGQGYDVHRFAPGRPLILGGVEIPHDRGLDGHSDADVLAHAVCDALLGAIAAGDLGAHFPSSDPRWEGARGKTLMAEVRKRVDAAGFALANVDATLIAQEPRLSPHLAEIRKGLAEMLGAALDQVSVKLKSNDKLGAIGRGEGVAAQAVVLLEPGNQ